MTKKYLVTGGTGFIGSALVKCLVNKGNHVRVLDNNFRGALSKLGDAVNKIEFIEADIRDSEAVFHAAKDVDCVIHLAFINGTEFFYSRPELVLDVGVRGMLNVVDACRRQDVKEMVLASSSEVYQTPARIPTDETISLSIPDVMNPRYSYAGGKIISELIAINYGRKGFERVMIFRPHNVYGPDMGYEHVIPQLITRALKLIEEKPEGIIPFSIQGDGSETRAFVHINDFLNGLMTVIEMGEHLNIYHIGNDEEISIKQLVHEIFALLGRRYEIIPGERPNGGTRRRCPDITKICKLGYRPQIPLIQGLRETIEWYKKHTRPHQERSLWSR